MMKRATRSEQGSNEQGEDDRIELLHLFCSTEAVERCRDAAQSIARGRFQPGIDALLSIVDDEPAADLVVQRKLADVYLDHGPVHPALESYHGADRTDEPQQAGQYTNLAVAYQARGQFNEARRVYARQGQLAHGPEVSEYGTRMDIARTFVAEGDDVRACEAYERIWAEAPSRTHAALQMAFCLLRLGQQTKARQVFERMAAMEGSFHRELALLALRQSAEAIPICKKAFASYRADPEPLYRVALAHLQLGDLESAQRYLQKATDEALVLMDEENEGLFLNFALTTEEREMLVRLWPEEDREDWLPSPVLAEKLLDERDRLGTGPGHQGGLDGLAHPAKE